MNGSQGKSYRVGVIGFAHMHVNELVDRFAATGRSPIVACADTVPRMPSLTRVEGSRKANLDGRLRCRAILAAMRTIVNFSQPSRSISSSFALRTPAMPRSPQEAAAAHGAHVVAEKPMAASSRWRALNGGRGEEVWCQACGQLADRVVASV